MNSEFLLNKTQVQKFQKPWDHYVIENFLPHDEFAQVQKALCKVEDGFHQRDDDPFELNFKFLPNLDLAKFFLSPDFQKFLERTTGKNLEIYPGGLVQLRLMTPESPAMPPHVDDQDERSLVCLWYLSDWMEGRGGELNLLTSKTGHPSEGKIIAPVANRMVLFFSDDCNWHSVNKVENWKRYSVISEWIVKG
ncbi:2OG-Fe(II) oxygenase [Bdellovibrio sp. HCB2-146]|uniref:2OG-Fe(II) oxygenase family protein n=1 Tax=Bdellovibrio sp. HCB2-146 TaxID=3394362 RepID=UPI0039BD73CE